MIACQDLRPKYYYKNEKHAQAISFPDGTITPILYDGSLPFIPERRPTPSEIENCRTLQLTSRDDCYHLKLRWVGMIADAASNIPTMYTDPISLALMSSWLIERDSSHQMSYMKQIKTEKSHDQMVFTTQNRVSLREIDLLSLEQLSRMWQIGLKTAKNTILATPNKCIRSNGMLSRMFKTDKSQLRYKQLSRHYGTFHVDFLKVTIKLLREYVGSMLYCNKLGFKTSLFYRDSRSPSSFTF